MTEKRGLEEAIEFLRFFKPVRMITDRLYLQANCTGKVESLGHSLRREARKPDNTNRVNVSYSPDGAGRDVAFYTYNVDYKPPERPVKAPTFFFFTLKHSPVCSPYMTTIAAVLNAPMYSRSCKIWTGSYDRPIPVDMNTLII